MQTPNALLRNGALAVTGLAIVVGLTIFFTGTASAHTSLTSSDPAEADTLTTAPAAVTLTFNQEVGVINPIIVVTGPDNTHYQAGEAAVDREIVSTGLNPLGPAGTYSVAYRIISADGHPVEGQYTFEYTPPPSEPITSTPEPATPAGPSSAEGGADTRNGPDTTSAASTTNPTETEASSTSPAATESTAVTSNVATADLAGAAEPTGTSRWIYIALAATAALIIAAIAVFAVQQRRKN